MTAVSDKSGIFLCLKYNIYEYFVKLLIFFYYGFVFAYNYNNFAKNNMHSAL